MKKIFKTLLMIIILATFIVFNNLKIVSAGTVNLNINANSTVVVGNTIDITINASDIVGFEKGLATAQGDISFDSNYLEYVSYANASSSLSSSYGTSTKRFVSLGMSGEFVASSDNLITLTFRAKTIGSTNVSLSNLVVGDAKAIVHSANSNVKTIEIVGEEPEGIKTPINSGGSSNPNSNTNSNTGKTPTSNKKIDKTPTAKSSNSDLENLIVNNAKMAPAFTKNNTSYNVTIPSDLDKLNLDYVTSDSKATVKVLGNENLALGKVNTVSIIVTAEDGSSKTYTLNVEVTNDSSSNKLAKLKIKESNLYPKFNSYINDYTIKLDKNIKRLTIDAIAEDKNSEVEIIDNKNLAKDSIVLIKVTDKNGFSNYYKLKIENKNKIGKKLIYIVLILLILAIFLLLILLFIKRRRKKDYDEPKNADDLYDDIVTKDELLQAIEENDKQKLKMLLTQEEANRLKAEVKKNEKEDSDLITKEQLLWAIESKDKKKIDELVKKEKMHKQTFEKSGPKTYDDRVKEEIIKAIQEKDVHKLNLIVQHENDNK